MDALIEQVRSVAAAVDAVGRTKLLDSLRDLQLSIETPDDTLNRMAGLQLEITAARIAEDLNLFQILTAIAPNSLTVQELASKTGAAPLLISRITRYLASVRMVKETGPSTFAANSTTKTLAHPGYRGGVYHFFDNVGPVFQVLPTFLAERGYADVTDAADTAFQKAFPEAGGVPAFVWLPSQPERFAHLQQVMTVQGRADGVAPWFKVFPFEAELEGFGEKTALVDVGGGFGHQCAGLVAADPGRFAGKGRLVLQDLPQTIGMLAAGGIPGIKGLFDDGSIKAQAHDFFAPQPVKGARFYYLRNVLHDWPDDKCVEILKNLAAAFGDDGKSHILIDEMVLPDQGVPWQAASIDLTMMASLGSRERTVSEWTELFDKAGLKAVRTDTYAPARRDSIIQVAHK